MMKAILRISRRSTLAASLALAVCSSAIAAPSVSGVSGSTAHGGLITINGSGFGSRNSYNNNNGTWGSSKFLNFRFKDFEDGQLNTQGFYAQRGGGNWSASSTELSARSGGPTNSKNYMRRAYSTGESGGLSASASGAGNQLYTTFKLMVDSGTQSGKFFRFYADSPQSNVYLSTGCSNYYVRGYSECTAGTCSPATEWGTGPQFQAGKWHRVEVWADGSSNTFSVSVDGTTAWTKRNWLASTLGLNGHTIDYPNMIDGPERGCATTGAYNFDDIFIDFTQARVEISDSATWSGAKKKEVQLPVSWNGTSIQARLNAGAFSGGSTAYVYVVDSSGAANEQGYRITLGGTSVQPNPPSSVSVQ